MHSAMAILAYLAAHEVAARRLEFLASPEIASGMSTIAASLARIFTAPRRRK